MPVHAHPSDDLQGVMHLLCQNELGIELELELETSGRTEGPGSWRRCRSGRRFESRSGRHSVFLLRRIGQLRERQTGYGGSKVRAVKRDSLRE